MRIASITSSRSDVGILRPVWQALVTEGADVHVITTGMHRAPGAPSFILDVPHATLHEAGCDLGGRADTVATSAMASIVASCGALYANLKPDLVLVVGDRLDMLPAAVAALPFNLPLAHLHGGEVTEGAIDDRARHAMTQLADLHLVSCDSAKARVRMMRGEQAKILMTGAPGLDTLIAAPELTRAEFLRETCLADVPGAFHNFVLSTVHPETNSREPQAPMAAVLAALDELKIPVLFTAPNSDPGGAEMRETLMNWIARRSFARFVETLGSRLYPNALRHAALMVGNSSSGIIEAGLFGLPVVNVGTRQRGRERGGNVRDVPSTVEAVRTVIEAALLGTRYAQSSPYGNGKAGPKIARAIMEFSMSSREIIQ